MLRPSYLLSDLHRGLRASCETFAEKPNGAPSSLSVIKKKHRHFSSAIHVRADEKLIAFVELERAIREFAVTVSQESVFNDCKAGFANGEVHRI